MRLIMATLRVGDEAWLAPEVKVPASVRIALV
jgi:cephalosporin-C deacetylase-like acetyl esterase